MNNNSGLIPIYTTRGDVGAFLAYPYIYNRQGEWVGWITEDRQVYSVHGHYVGWLSADPRILRKQAHDYPLPRLAPPHTPPALRAPATVPLAPLLPELPIGAFDVLDEDPDLLPAVDYGDLREDMD